MKNITNWIKRNLTFILFLGVPIIILFFSASFIAMSLNPSKWGIIIRISFVALSISSTLLIASKLFK